MTDVRVLHEASILGQAAFDVRARSGVFRVQIGTCRALAGRIPQAFSALHGPAASLGLEHLAAQEPDLLPGPVLPTWTWPHGLRAPALSALRAWTGLVHTTPRFDPRRMALAAAVRATAVSARPILRTEYGEVLHSWYHALPSAGTWRRRVLTIHDLAHLCHPAWFPLGASTHFQTILASVRREDEVIVPSTSTADDLRRYLPDHPVARLHVVPFAVDPVFSPQARPAAPPLGLEGPYLLALGTREPRKNLARLLAAYGKVCAGRRDPPFLAIAGSMGWGPELAALGPWSKRVRLLGRVDDAVLPALVAGALALVYPSLFEGFGLPPLEAMASGVPVVASATTALPEVVGKVGLLVDPTSVDAIADAVTRLLDDAGLREDLAARGLEQAATFTWQRTAEGHLGVYGA